MPTGGDPETAFVLGGGGLLGAAEVGMLRALAEREIRPDVVLGTSIGAANGAFVAADPTPGGVDRLAERWTDQDFAELSLGNILRRASTFARSGTHVESFAAVRDRLAAILPTARLEDLAIPFQCVAASIERAAEHWFVDGPLPESIMASCAVPGLLPPIRIGGEHFIDGGIVNSIPVSRAVVLGARRIFVMQVGRLEHPLSPPRRPWEVALVAFEVARRHRFAYDLGNLPDSIELHVLPTGGSAAPPPTDIASQLRLGRIARSVGRQIDAAHEASRAYLDEHAL